MSTLPTSDEMSWLFSSPGLGLGDRHLAQHRRIDADDAELGQVAAEFLQALQRPGRHDAGEVAARHAVVVLEHGAEALGREQAERRLVDRRTLDRVDRARLHHRLEALGDRRLAAADGTEQVEDLLAFLEALRRVLEEGHDLLDRVFHAVELAEGRVTLDDAVAEEAGEALVVAGVDELGLADAGEHPLGGGGVHRGVTLAQFEIIVEGKLLLLRGGVIRPKRFEQRTHSLNLSCNRAPCRIVRRITFTPRQPGQPASLPLVVFEMQNFKLM